MTTRIALLALLGLTLARLLVAAITPLAPDEAYYWVWSHALAPGYFDHPPMVALWIRAGIALAGDTALGIRLSGPISAALGSLLLADAANRLFPGRRLGIPAAALMNATLLFGIGSVTMTPDTPLLFFWTLALWSLARLLETGNPRWWLAVGAAAGLALDSKYTAALLAPALLAWLLLTPNLCPMLGRWQLWAGAALALLIFAPVLWWNADHQWVSFLKQGGRVGDFNASRALQFLGELAGGQIGLATPGIFLLCAAGTAAATRRWRDTPCLLLASLVLVPTLVFLQHAFGDRVQANWPSLLYPQACIAAAALATTPRWQRWLSPSLVLGLGLTLIVWVQGALAPLALPMRADPTLLRLGGWSTLATGITAEADRQGAAYIVSDNYSHAALLARLLPPGRPVLGIDERWASFALPGATPLITGRPGILVRSARRDDHPDPADWASITPLPGLTRARNGMVAEGFRLYRVVGRAGDEPIVVLPRPQ
jgi:4-amino-4-deoxy-L-arabinose transferase-like glycosyltransferase